MNPPIPQNESTNHLKNVIESKIIKRFVKGADVIEVGIGTGRASLPLVVDGYKITGIDSSQALLDQARRLAQSAPITLKVGDIADLPCDDNAFDSAISLNVLAHFPNWREALPEWKRVIRPGGRIIFDVFSLDHVTVCYGLNSAEKPTALKRTEDSRNSEHYVQRLSSEEIISFADAAGFTVTHIIPYGAFLGGENTNWFLHSDLESKYKWKRLLSWFARDQALFDFGLFLEEFFVWHLTPKVSGRMFVVLENKEGCAANARFMADMAARNEALNQNDLSALLPWLPLSLEEYAVELHKHLQPLRCKYFFFRLLQSLIARHPDFNFRGVIPDETLAQYSSWSKNDRIDKQATEIARNWASSANFRFKDGVDVTSGIEYGLMRALLTEYFGLFPREQQ